MKKIHVSDLVKRPIQTIYSLGTKVTKVTHSLHSNSAVMNCVNHMQLNHYGATLAEVFDNQVGTLHALIKRKINGDLVIIYKRLVTEGM
jgi:hypothetical protein